MESLSAEGRPRCCGRPRHAGDKSLALLREVFWVRLDSYRLRGAGGHSIAGGLRRTNFPFGKQQGRSHVASGHCSESLRATNPTGGGETEQVARKIVERKHRRSRHSVLQPRGGYK